MRINIRALYYLYMKIYIIPKDVAARKYILNTMELYPEYQGELTYSILEKLKHEMLYYGIWR